MTILGRSIIILIGIILIFIGLANIWDDARVLTYDLTAIFLGIGFVVLGFLLRRLNK